MNGSQKTKTDTSPKIILKQSKCTNCNGIGLIHKEHVEVCKNCKNINGNNCYICQNYGGKKLYDECNICTGYGAIYTDIKTNKLVNLYAISNYTFV